MPSGSSFVPNSDERLLNWSASFRDQIVATPTAFFTTAAIAAAYSLVHNAYATALATALNKTTRTESTVATKDACKRTLQIQARSLGGMIQKNVNVTDAQKLGLGITVRATPSPIPPPSSQPLVEVISVTGRTVSLRFKSTATIGKRGRPSGTAGLQVYSLVAAEPSQNPSDWTFCGTTSKTLMDVEFPATVAAGAQVWFVASWISPRLQTGPASNAVTTHLQYGNTVVAMPQEARKRRAA